MFDVNAFNRKFNAGLECAKLSVVTAMGRCNTPCLSCKAPRQELYRVKCKNCQALDRRYKHAK